MSKLMSLMQYLQAIMIFDKFKLISAIVVITEISLILFELMHSISGGNACGNNIFINAALSFTCEHWHWLCHYSQEYGEMYPKSYHALTPKRKKTA